MREIQHEGMGVSMGKGKCYSNCCSPVWGYVQARVGVSMGWQGRRERLRTNETAANARHPHGRDMLQRREGRGGGSTKSGLHAHFLLLSTPLGD